MKTIDICGNSIRVKDYWCIETGDFFRVSEASEYLHKPKPMLWLYVNVTDRCNARCRFCVSQSSSFNTDTVDVTAFKKTLAAIKPHISGVSFTGGEPMLYPDTLEELVDVSGEILSDDVEIDLATNGTNLLRLSHLKNIDRFTTIHISRHSASDSINTALMGREGPSVAEIKDFTQNLKDPGKVVLNCVLQKGGVEKCRDVAEYLDSAIYAGVQNSSFITMFMANEYCRENYLSAHMFPFVSDAGYAEWNRIHPDSQFSVWHRFSDREYCHCISGDYRNKYGRTRFYFRCPGNDTPVDYCRQLVYTADNRLQDGFGSGRKTLLESGLL